MKYDVLSFVLFHLRGMHDGIMGRRDLQKCTGENIYMSYIHVTEYVELGVSYMYTWLAIPVEGICGCWERRVQAPRQSEKSPTSCPFRRGLHFPEVRASQALYPSQPKGSCSSHSYKKVYTCIDIAVKHESLPHIKSLTIRQSLECKSITDSYRFFRSWSLDTSTSSAGPPPGDGCVWSSEARGGPVQSRGSRSCRRNRSRIWGRTSSFCHTERMEWINMRQVLSWGLHL